eukprot:2185494-Rhodomonas_salina.1
MRSVQDARTSSSSSPSSHHSTAQLIVIVIVLASQRTTSSHFAIDSSDTSALRAPLASVTGMVAPFVALPCKGDRVYLEPEEEPSTAEPKSDGLSGPGAGGNNSVEAFRRVKSGCSFQGVPGFLAVEGAVGGRGCSTVGGCRVFSLESHVGLTTV